MFSSDRRNAIQQLLVKNKRLDVVRLSAQFGVSEVTIRKDLEYLENQGVLIRTHGGAVIRESSQESSDELPHTQFPFSEPILRMGRIAANLINDNELIYLGTCPICTAMASYLTSKKITVVTNNLSVASTLSQTSSVKVIIAGGILGYDDDTAFSYGTDTVSFLAKNNYDKAILGIDAVNMKGGFALRNSDIQTIYQEVLAESATKIFCVSGERFDKKAFFQLAPIDFPDMIISDEQMPEEYIGLFYQHGIKVFTSYDVESL